MCESLGFFEVYRLFELPLFNLMGSMDVFVRVHLLWASLVSGCFSLLEIIKGVRLLAFLIHALLSSNDRHQLFRNHGKRNCSSIWSRKDGNSSLPVTKCIQFFNPFFSSFLSDELHRKRYVVMVNSLFVMFSLLFVFCYSVFFLVFIDDGSDTVI